jgi:hypothetical protein
VAEALRQVPGARQVTTDADGRWTTARITTDAADADIRPALGKAAVERGWPIRAMRYETGSLEQLFIQVTGETPAATEVRPA